MLNHRNRTQYYLYTKGSTGSYGQPVIDTEPIASFIANVVESDDYRRNDDPRAGEETFFTVCSYFGAKPGMVLSDGVNRYEITRVINSTRFAQLYLKKI